jgi:hypothetical protein
MHSVKRVKRVIHIPHGYDGHEYGASVPQDDASSVISDNGDYPDGEQSEVEYISDYEMSDSDNSSTETETDTETEPQYKALESVLAEEVDFAEINF